jgi:hypothetical protein
VSLPFVPHLNTEKGFAVEWHRLEKECRFDLSYNPLDYEERVVDWSVDQYTWPDTLESEVHQFAVLVASNASAFLDPLRSVEALLSAFEAKRNRKFIRLRFEDYPQEVLAYAFVLARLGQPERAREAFGTFERSIREFDDYRDMPDASLKELADLLRQGRL